MDKIDLDTIDSTTTDTVTIADYTDTTIEFPSTTAVDVSCSSDAIWGSNGITWEFPHEEEIRKLKKEIEELRKMIADHVLLGHGDEDI